MKELIVGTNRSPEAVADYLVLPAEIEARIVEAETPQDAAASGCDAYVGGFGEYWLEDNLASAPIPSLEIREHADGPNDDLTAVSVHVSPGSPWLVIDEPFLGVSDEDAKPMLTAELQWSAPHTPFGGFARGPAWALAAAWLADLTAPAMAGLTQLIRDAEALERELALLLSDKKGLEARLTEALSDKDFAMARVLTLEAELQTLRADLAEAVAAQASGQPLRIQESDVALRSRGKNTIAKLALVVASVSPFVADYLSNNDTQAIVDAVSANTQAQLDEQHQIHVTLDAGFRCIVVDRVPVDPEPADSGSE